MRTHEATTMHPSFHTTRGARRQRGAILVSALLMLLVLTVSATELSELKL